MTGCGAGLVAAGGLALLLTLAAPERPSRLPFAGYQPEAESARRDRNARAGSRIGAAATVAGSLLLIIGADKTSVIVAAACAAAFVIVALWLYLAYEVRRSYLVLVRSMQTSRSGAPTKRAIYQSQAIYVGMGVHYEPGRGMADMPVNDPNAALAKAEARTSWRWALRHPLGARGDGI